MKRMSDLTRTLDALEFARSFFEARAQMATPGSEGACKLYECAKGCADAMEMLKAQEPEALDAPKPDSDIGCWYDITHNYTLEQVVNALKAQEPRVMTLEEVKQHNNQDGCVWFEQPTYNAVAAFVRRDEEYTEIISPYLLGEPINHGYMANRFYGLAWRCWSTRPSDEVRRATPWN